MSTQSFIANVNSLANNIDIINELAESLNETNIAILSQLLGEIDLTPIIDDLSKGLFNGNRQIKIDLIENYLEYSSNMTEEQLVELYNSTSLRPQYSSIVFYLTDGTEHTVPFTQDGKPINVSTNIEVYTLIATNQAIADVLENITINSVPEVVTGSNTVFSDSITEVSNLLSVGLIGIDGNGKEINPTYDWGAYTSSLMLLSQYYSSLQLLANNLSEFLGLPEELETSVVELEALKVEAESAIERAFSITADPSTANVGEVLTVEYIDGQKVSVYKSISDAGGFNIPPATTNTLGGVKVGTGLEVTPDGIVSLAGGQDEESVIAHNSDPDAHKDVIMDMLPVASTAVAGITKLSSSISSNSTTTAANSAAVYALGASLSGQFATISSTVISINSRLSSYSRIGGIPVADDTGKISSSWLPDSTHISTPAQCIVRAPEGIRPDKFSTADCDAPVVSMLTPNIIPHTTHYGVSGTVYANSIHDTSYKAWEALDGLNVTSTNCWRSASGVGTTEANPAIWGYKFSVPRRLGDTIYVTCWNGTATANMKTGKIMGITENGGLEELASYTEQPPASNGFKLEYRINPTFNTKYKEVYFEITASNSTYIVFGEVEFTFTDVEEDTITIPSGLQVSYADNGITKLSNTLDSNQTLSIYNVEDGVHYVYAALTANGDIDNFYTTPFKPEAGPNRKNTRLIDAEVFPNSTFTTSIGKLATIEVSGVYSNSNSHAAYNLTDHSYTSAWSGVNKLSTGSIKFTFKEARKFTGFMFRTSGDTNRAPKDYDIYVDDILVKSVRNQIHTIANQDVYVDFDVAYKEGTEVIMDILSIKAATNTNYIALTEATPLYETAWYDTINNIMYNGNPYTNGVDTSRQVYIGYFTKYNGKVTDLVCYSKGTEAVLPLHTGEYITVNTVYYTKQPFILNNPQYQPWVYDDGAWVENNREMYYNWNSGSPISYNRGITAKTSKTQDLIYVQTGSYSLQDQFREVNRVGGASTPTPNNLTRGKLVVKRGY